MHISTIKRKKDRSWKYWAFLLIIFITNFFSLIPCSLEGYRKYFSLLMFVQTSFWTSIDKFRLQFVSTLYLLLLYMANHTTDGLPRMIPAPSSLTSTMGPIALIHISNLMIQPRHRTFPGRPDFYNRSHYFHQEAQLITP